MYNVLWILEMETLREMHRDRESVRERKRNGETGRVCEKEREMESVWERERYRRTIYTISNDNSKMSDFVAMNHRVTTRNIFLIPLSDPKWELKTLKKSYFHYRDMRICEGSSIIECS